MANPKRKWSKARTHKRRAAWKIENTTMAVCAQCHQPKQPHRLCSNCGYYKGKEIVNTEND